MNTNTETEIRYIYVVKCFSSRRHKVSNTDMYFEYPIDVEWAFQCRCICKDCERYEVHYIKVHKNSQEYESAVGNSNKARENRMSELMDELIPRS